MGLTRQLTGFNLNELTIAGVNGGFIYLCHFFKFLLSKKPRFFLHCYKRNGAFLYNIRKG
jgi:hypothetical protein